MCPQRLFMIMTESGSDRSGWPAGRPAGHNLFRNARLTLSSDRCAERFGGPMVLASKPVLRIESP